MNSTLEIPNSPPPDPSPATEPLDAGGPDSSHRARGKIACLPKKVRDHLNQMLEDGVRYAQIKENLGEHGKDLTLDNISQWKKRGHQLWLKQQFWREEMRARMDAFTDLLGDTDPAQLPMAGLQMSLTQLCEQLRDLGPGSRKDQFEADADKYLRMLNTLSRLSKSQLALQKFQRDSAAGTAVELKRLDPNRKISEAEEMAMQDRADDFFGWKSAARLKHDLDSVTTQPEGLTESSRGSQSAETPGNSPAALAHPDGMPQSPARIRSDPAANNVTIKSDPDSKIENQNSKIPEVPQPGGLRESSRGSQSAETPGNSPAASAHPEGMPQSPARIPSDPAANNVTTESDSDSKIKIQNSKIPEVPQPGGLTESSRGNSPTASAHPEGMPQSPQSQIENQNSKIESPELCPKCQHILPPLTLDGRRPWPACWFCGVQLLEPNTELCPNCQQPLPSLAPDGQRPYPDCRHCGAPVPPPPCPAAKNK